MAAARWTVWIETACPDGTIERHEVGSVRRDMSSPNPADLGLHLAEAKDLLHKLQLRLVQDQADQASALDRACAGCGSKRILHDRRRRVVATLFGQVAVRQPRWHPCRCGRSEANALSRVHALLGASATPELVRVQAELGARLSLRVRRVEQSLAGLLGSDLEHKGPLHHAQFEAERLRHLIWNGYGDEARRVLPNIGQMAENAIWTMASAGEPALSASPS